MTGRLQFNFLDAVLWWLLANLLAILFIADYPLIALATAIAGGIALGVLLVLGSKTIPR